LRITAGGYATWSGDEHSSSMGHVRIAVVVRCRGATECNNGVAAGRCDERAERFRHNVPEYAKSRPSFAVQTSTS